MSDYSIGIDTGGTYTDAVIIDIANHEVIATAKALTTHNDLAVGIQNALGDVMQLLGNLSHTRTRDSTIPHTAIAKVCLSTTLATNALIEGQGSAITVILIGFDEAMQRRTEIATAIPDAQVISVAGGHIYTGAEQAALNLDDIGHALTGPAGQADAFAIASHYSVRNTAHEHQVADYIESVTRKPCSLSCELSDSLNGPKRALTAAFNARIISLIVKLHRAVTRSLEKLQINAPIVIVKGDGSVASSASVINKPIETILSGPAASVIGARYLTGLTDFVVADIGGTTTDVATVNDGWPGLNEQGADVGGYRTLVKAIDMRTLGLGGDSAVDVDTQGKTLLHQHRVLPISLLAHQWPALLPKLEAALGANSGMRSAIHYLVAASDFNTMDLTALGKRERELIHRLNPQEPVRQNDVVYGAADRSAVRKLLERGFVRLSGFTPSDAAHVLGHQSQWNAQAARIACELLGRSSGRVMGNNVERDVNKLAKEVCELVSQASAHLMIEQLSKQNLAADHPLVSAAITDNGAIENLSVTLSPTIPLVAVGGPAPVFYPRVGELLGSETTLLGHGGVANAIGAAVGLVRSEYHVEITSNQGAGYIVHEGGDPQTTESAVAAIELASKLASQAVLEKQKVKGGHSSNVHIQVKRLSIPNMDENAGLISATVTAVCDSMPRVRE